MIRRIGIIGTFAVVFTALGVVTALAVTGTFGVGKTALGNTLGFNAKADLTGQFEYQFSTGGTDYNIHCDSYSSYVQTTTPSGAWPKSLVGSTHCFDLDGVRYYVHAEFVDRGEPGTNDSACITVKLYPGRLNPVLYKDCGKITAGNIQILPNSSPASAEMLSTSP